MSTKQMRKQEKAEGKKKKLEALQNSVIGEALENNVVEEPLTIETVELEEANLETKEKLVNLTSLLAELLVDKSRLEKIKIDLNLDGKFVELLKSINLLFPNLFTEMDASLKDIVSDKVIDSKDVPKLIVLIKNVYKKFNDSKEFKKINNISVGDSINFIKNLLLLLIELEYIKVDDKDSVILIIDLCIDLLTTSVDVTEGIIDKIRSCFC